MKTSNVIVAFTEEKDFWFDRPDVYKFTNLDQVKNKLPELIPDIDYVCVISAFGILFEYSPEGFLKKYSCPDPTPDMLDYICNSNFFDAAANAKLWYSCFMYAIKNKKCDAFWQKYKDTYAGSKLMSIILSSKNS